MNEIETLRKAAAKMRVLATTTQREKAASWFATGAAFTQSGFEAEDGDFIASMTPLVALAVADLLGTIANRAADMAGTINSPRVAAATIPENVVGFTEALTLARRYLGSDPA